MQKICWDAPYNSSLEKRNPKTTVDKTETKTISKIFKSFININKKCSECIASDRLSKNSS